MHPDSHQSSTPSPSQLQLDQSNRWRRGERALVEKFLDEFPELRHDSLTIYSLIRSEVTLRAERGEDFTLDEYLTRFPAHAQALHDVWAGLVETQTKLTLGNVDLQESPTIASDIVVKPSFLRSLPGLELFEKIGEGAVGVVYRALDLRLNQPRAIKVIRSGPFAGKDAQERFGREARAAARLDHPGLVRVHSLGEHFDILFICMEYVAGGSLSSFLAKSKLDVRQSVEIVRDIAGALQHAHSNKVLHRDLKPSNVLLTAERHPKIADFGLAKLIDDCDELTLTGAVMGTPAYMAPEQAEGRLKDIDERTDIWALGAILYECLTRHLPFFGSDRNQIMELVRRHTPSPPSRLNPDVPGELDAVCFKCLQKRKEDRYQSAEALATELQNWLDGKGTIALAAARRKRKQTRWKVGILAAIFAAGLIVAAVYLRSPKADSEQKAESTELVPGQWHSLLTKEPGRLIWPNSSRMNWQAESKELMLASPELALVPLGESGEFRYRLSISMEQAPLAGHLGLYFGYAKRTFLGQQGVSYQVLELAPIPDPGVGLPRFLMEWKTITHIGPRWIIERHGSDVVIALAPGKHVLELTVGPSHLEKVTWDDEVLPALEGSKLEKPIPAEESRGGFGVYINNGSGIFRDARYQFEQEK